MLAGSDVDSCFMKTSLNATEGVRYFHASAYSILTVFGSILNILLLVVIRMDWSRLKESNFYFLVVGLCCSSLTYLLPNYIIMIPCTAFQCAFYSNTVMVVFAAFNTVGYYTSLFTTFVITVERFVLFFMKNVYFHFSRLVWLIAASAWVLGLSLLGITVGMGCFKRFNRYTFQYTFFCSECAEDSQALSDALFVLGQILPAVMITAYAAIFLNVLISRRSSGHFSNGDDCRLAFQFTVICTFQWFSAFFFFMVPRVFGTSHLGVLATNVCGILNTSINPIVLFAFNSRIKQGFSKRLRFRRSTIVSSQHRSPVTQTQHNRAPWTSNTVVPHTQ